MAKFPTYEEMGKKIAEEALDGYVYKDKTLREWINILAQTRWIPVTEKLPEENKIVIVSTENGVYPETRYTKEYGWQWAYEAGADYWTELMPTVTAWMALPEPYETEKEVKK